MYNIFQCALGSNSVWKGFPAGAGLDFSSNFSVPLHSIKRKATAANRIYPPAQLKAYAEVT